MKKKYIAYIVCVAIIAAFIISCHRETLIVTESNSTNYLQVDDGYYLDVYLKGQENSVKNGVIHIESPDEIFYARVENIGKARQFILKVYMDYVETPIQVDNQSSVIYNFSAPSEYSCVIPFTIDNGIDTSKKHKMTVSLISGADINVGILNNPLTDHYSLSLNYSLIGQGIENIQPEERDYELIPAIPEGMFSGILINSDLSGNTANKLPEKIFEVDAGSKLSLGYRVGGYELINHFCIIVNLGWNQTKIEDSLFKLVKTAEAGDLG